MNQDNLQLPVILPGQTIGILGGGQLGRMIALEGRKMGYRFAVLDPMPDCPTAQVADQQVVADFTDATAAQELARMSDIITYEFENVDANVAHVLEEQSYVPQGSDLLRVTQHRVREKSTLARAGIPVTPFEPVTTRETFETAIQRLGLPAVLKTSTGGYDGKGQWLLKAKEDLLPVWEEARKVVTESATHEKAHFETSEAAQDPSFAPLIVEKFIHFVKEVSAVVARSVNGEVAIFPIAENIHRHHILHLSIVPARINPGLEQRARALGRQIAEALDVVGLIAVEMFVTEAGDLFVNELAPRPHNSGHYTYDACMTSQFEQHVRAICNLPLGPTNLLTPVVMVNVLGEHVEPLLAKIPSLPGNIKVHLYGKQDAKPKRKMGHLNVLAQSTEAALKQIASLGIWEV